MHTFVIYDLYSYIPCTGVDIIADEKANESEEAKDIGSDKSADYDSVQGRVVKFRVENSWG